MANRCNTCRFWSEMIAQSIGCGPIQALCQHDTTYYEWDTCPDCGGTGTVEHEPDDDPPAFFERIWHSDKAFAMRNR